MAFRTYKDQLSNPTRAPWGGSAPKQKSDRTWRQVTPPDDNPNTIRLGQPASMKDQIDVQKGVMDIRKDQQTIEGKDMEQMGNDMVFRAVFGHPQKELNSVLESSTTGYQDPGAQKFQKDPFAIDRMKAAAKPPRVPGQNTFEERRKMATETALEHIGTYKKGMKDVDKNEITWDSIWREVTGNSNFKEADKKDPRFEQARQAFENPPEDVPPWRKVWDKFSDKIGDVRKNAGAMWAGQDSDSPPADTEEDNKRNFPEDFVNITDSSGKTWNIPREKLDAARKRDPGLTVH